MNLFQVKQYKTFGHTTQIEKQKRKFNISRQCK